MRIDPVELGIRRVHREDLAGGTPEDNARITKAIFGGHDTGARHDIVALNAGAGLYVAGLVDDLDAGYAACRAAIGDGRAAATLDALVTFTNNVANDPGA
jgi:anthranilate phosphoribosyltransferase